MKEKIMDVTKYFNPKKVDEDMNTMNSFGIRLTGTDAQNEFCEWIKAQIINSDLTSTSLPTLSSVGNAKIARLSWTAKTCMCRLPSLTADSLAKTASAESWS